MIWAKIGSFLWKARGPLLLMAFAVGMYAKGASDTRAHYKRAAAKVEAEWKERVSEAENASYRQGVRDAHADARNQEIVNDIREHAAQEPGASDDCLSADTVERLRSLQ